MPESRCELVAIAPADLPILQTMATYYVYDMSEFCGWEFPDTGLYGCEPFDKYFADPDAHCYFVRVAGELGGFAVVDTKGSSPEVEFNMAQFFVHRKFKGRGIGAWAASTLFARFPGLWEVNVIPENRAAFAFWRAIIHRAAAGPVEEGRRPAPHLKGAIKDIFRFHTA
ncbi:MAG TPA: GNAT family N-acetyltransferase [Caulobacteraceae bacterium]|nr:GNAT family N-acetyltransferase [Caulobacteraceae bacterium]